MDGDLAEVLVVLGVFVAATIRITPMISQIQVSFNNLAFGRDPISSLYKDLLTKREKSSNYNLSKKSNELQEKEAFKEIILKGVSYSYPNSSENSLGSLFSYFMMETIILGKLTKINPFNQPAVEQVKKLTKKLLS